MKRALVLGCGPAGLLAVHALRMQGMRVEVVSRKEPSFIAGAQYLHSAIPELTDEIGEEVQYYKYGTKEGYALKIYGYPDAGTSWTKFEAGIHEAWPLERYYHRLWDLYESVIYDGEFLPGMLELALVEYQVVVSTIPLRNISPYAKFESESVFLVPGLVGRQPELQKRPEDNFIVYEGNPRTPWYRASRLWGQDYTEFPVTFHNARYMSGSRMVNKPLGNNFVNPYPNLFLLGRYGKWQKGVLVDDAFREAMQIGAEL